MARPPLRPGLRKPFEAVPIKRGSVYRRKQKRALFASRLKAASMLLGVTALVFMGGMTVTNWPTLRTVIGARQTNAIHFTECGLVRRNCVIDGDTFWLDGRKIRVADVDTPEISEPRCQWEYDRGIQAKHRLRELLNAGPIELEPIPGRDKDQYGRELRVVLRGGRSLGDQLVNEGFARTWTGRREPWC